MSTPNIIAIRRKVEKQDREMNEPRTVLRPTNDSSVVMYDAIIGQVNTIYYQVKFDNFDKKGPGLKASWNWPAFFLGAYWAIYRKMYAWFFLLIGISIIFTDGYLISMIVFAIFANSLYQQNLTSKIAKAKATINEKSKLIEHLKNKGGVNIWVIWVWGVIAILMLIGTILTRT